MKKFLHTLKVRSTYIRIYIFILLPTLLLLCYSIFVLGSYSVNYREFLCTSYVHTLSAVYARLEDSLQGIVKMVRFLSMSDEFMESLSGELSDENMQVGTVLLRQIKEDNPLVDSIFVADRGNKTVYGSLGTEDFDKFFTLELDYENYDLSYWRFYQSAFSEYAILPPSKLNQHGTVKTVMPMVFTQINGVPMSQMLIVNISVTHILEILESNHLTDNSSFLLVNKLTQTAYGADDKASVDNDFYENLLLDQSAVFDTTFNGCQAMAITYSPDVSIMGYSYAAIVPFDDINSVTRNSIMTHIAIGICVIGIMLFFVRFGVKGIYNPVRRLADVVGIEEPSSDLILNISEKIVEIQQKNSNLSRGISKLLPIARERKLIQSLNSYPHQPIDEEIDLPGFCKKYFCSVIIKLYFTEKFYADFNARQYDILYLELYEMINSYFREKCTAYVISNDVNTLYALLNLETEDTETIEGIVHDIKIILAFDSDYIKVYASKGGIYSDSDGLWKSHSEAIKAISSVMTLSDLQLHLDTAHMQNTTCLFTQSDEANLTKFLMTEKIDKVKDMIKELTQANMGISEMAVMRLNTQLLTIIFKVMRLKGISYDSEDRGDLSIIQDILTHAPSEVYDILNNILDAFSKQVKHSNRIDINKVIEYLQENFTRDLSVEIVAELFGTSAKYLSRKFKDTVGVYFSKYLLQLRLEHAKMLLVSTKKSIDEVLVESGFNNRSTFIRAFKNYTGNTPGKWRELNAKQ